MGPSVIYFYLEQNLPEMSRDQYQRLPRDQLVLNILSTIVATFFKQIVFSQCSQKNIMPQIFAAIKAKKKTIFVLN
jgi:hypothetical protein